MATLSQEVELLRRRLDALEGRAPVIKRLDLQAHVQKLAPASGKRTLRGIATLPEIDRTGEIVDPLGGSWDLPLPLLWQHKHDQPIGWVRELRATASGVHMVAEVAEGVGRADEAWGLVTAGLVNSFSIGFVGLQSEPIPTGRRWKRWSLLEVSVVTIPAAPGAKITATKSNRGGIPLVNMRGAVRLVRSDKR